MSGPPTLNDIHPIFTNYYTVQADYESVLRLSAISGRR